MSERRQYFRVETLARVGLRLVTPDREQSLRHWIRARPSATVPSTIGDDARIAPEQRLLVDLMQRIAFSLDRIEHRLDCILRQPHDSDSSPAVAFDPIDVTVSGSGISGRFRDAPAHGELAEVTLDIYQAGLPVIYALARVTKGQENADPDRVALIFEELAAEDQERIIQFTIRSQSRILRVERAGDS